MLYDDEEMRVMKSMSLLTMRINMIGVKKVIKFMRLTGDMSVMRIENNEDDENDKKYEDDACP
jgi:hypothetical protein